MDKQPKIELLKKLRKIIHTRPDRRPKWFDAQYGLCSNIEQLAGRSGFGYRSLKALFGKDVFNSWPLYSGDNDFPIPATSGCSPTDQYFNQMNQFDRRSPYCKMRYELLDHLIAQASVV